MTAVEYLITHLKETYHLTEETLYEFKKAKEMEKQQIMDAIEHHIDLFKETEISDEEIEIVSLHKFMKGLKNDSYLGFIEGAKWYREQLKKK